MDEPIVIYQNLPTSIRGFCYQDDDGQPFVVLNSRLSREQNRITYRHERKHIASGDITDAAYIEYR